VKLWGNGGLCIPRCPDLMFGLETRSFLIVETRTFQGNQVLPISSRLYEVNTSQKCHDDGLETLLNR
jgi:hypothetical protein